MPLRSTSTPSVGSPYTSSPGGTAAQGDPPPMNAEPRKGADSATAGDTTYHRVSQAVQRAAAVRRATLSSRGPARTLSMEEEQFIRLHHGCQG